MGVSVFFVMSGFLMFRKHENDEMDLTIKNRAKFSLSRISKLYQLHIITMCFAVVLEMATRIYSGLTFRGVVYTLGKIVLNVTLMQTWVPYSNINVSLNGVAWFLSVTMFLYFMFPVIAKWIKTKSEKVLICISVFVLIVQILMCIPFIILLGEDSQTYIWFMYCFPIFRLGDFFIGCCLAKCYSCEAENADREESKVLASVIEIAVLIFTVLIIKWIRTETDNAVLMAMKNWTTLYIPIAVVWILLFSKNKGILTQMMTTPVFIFLGNISSYLFLIHYVVIQYAKFGMGIVSFEPHGLVKYMIILSELILSVILAMVYKRYKERSYPKAQLQA